MSEPQRILDGNSSEGSIVLPRGAPDGKDHQPDETRGSLGERVDAIVRGLGRKLATAFPRLEEPLSVCRGLYADAYVRSVRAKYNTTHVAPIEPLRIHRVDPDRISLVAEPTGLSRFRWAGLVADGEWDKNGVRFTDSDVYQAFRSHFRDGTPWENTAFFQRVIEEIADGAEPWGCDSRAAFEHRCRRLDELYESIRKSGFRTQRELAESNSHDPLERTRGTVTARVLNDEVAVDIGRDGELLYADGRNRLAIAKVLDVETIPVIVLRRHAQWCVLRDVIVRYVERTGDTGAPYSNHPDIEPYLS